MTNKYVNSKEYDTALENLGSMIEKNKLIEQELYSRYNVKRGLRNSDGTGVLVGLTEIGEVHSYVIDEGERFL